MTKQKKISMIFALLSITFLLFVLFLNNKEPTPKTTTQIQKEKTERYITISGIDKEPLSELYGQLVLEEINVWSWDEKKNRRDVVVARVRHGDRVKVLDEKTTDQKYYKIETTFADGWVSEQMVEP